MDWAAVHVFRAGRDGTVEIEAMNVSLETGV
jgi:hypothetical protein